MVKQALNSSSEVTSRILFAREMSELEKAAEEFPKYRPTVKTEDQDGVCGPRIVPGGDDYARLHRLAVRILAKLESTSVNVLDGEHTNPAGRLTFWALPDKRPLLSSQRPSDNVFLTIADALESLSQSPLTATAVKDPDGTSPHSESGALPSREQAMAAMPTKERLAYQAYQLAEEEAGETLTPQQAFNAIREMSDEKSNGFVPASSEALGESVLSCHETTGRS